MTRAKKLKKRKGNPKGRKAPAFAQTIRLITKDTLLTLEELTSMQKEEQGDEFKIKEDEKKRVEIESHELPPGTTTVDTLNGCYAYSDLRMARHIETMKVALREFNDDFFNLENGQSIMDLRLDKKGKLWADDATILNFCYTAIAMGLAVWTYRRNEWPALSGGMPYIKFIFDKKPEIKEIES